jgi:hypothetical protein
VDNGIRPEVRFAPDSLLEQAGFELPVPLATVSSEGSPQRATRTSFSCAQPCLSGWDREFADSPLEGNGFELSVPP